MNGVTKATTPPVQVKPAAVVASSNPVEKGQKTGNELPPVTEAATNSSSSVKDLQVVQEKVQAAVAQINEYIQSTQRDLHFSYDPESGNTIVKVVDRNTQEVIRQIPDQIFLKLAESFSQDSSLSLLNTRV